MKRFLSVLVAAVACAMNVAATAQVSTADLSIANDDGVSAVMPGGSVSYTITASNAGPNDAPGSTVADTFPASLTCSWSCVGTNAGTCAASGYGNINDTVNLPNGGSVTYTANCSISAGAKGSLSNTAMVIAPGGMTDSAPANNSATDTDTFAADLSITNTDGVTTAIPGGAGPVVYTITASNVGPGDAPGSTVADTFPAGLTCTWTCAGAGGGTCTASGSGNINSVVNLPSGGSVTYSASCTIASSATGSMINTATVTGTVNDPVPANNSATDTDTLTPQVNLSVTNTDNSPTAIAGKNVFYTVRASNQNGGPSDAPGSIVTDNFPAPLVCTWTCSGTGGATCAAPSGSGNINGLVNLPKNGRITYSATCALPAGAAPGSSLNNTATVATAAGITETTPADNTLSDIDTVVGQPDLSVTVSDGVTTVNPGDSVTYTMTVANGGSQGPSNAPGTSVVGTFPSMMACTWTCSGANGATCAASGSGNIHHTLDLPSGSSVTYIAHCTVSAAATGTLVNVMSATPAAGMVETITSNDAASDSDVVNVSANIALTMTDNQDFAQVGNVVDYVIDVTNPSGPAPATAEVIDVLPPELDNGSWTCTPSGGASCNSGGGNTLVDIVTIPVGGKVEYVYSAVVKSTPADEQIVNTASASLNSGTDAATADNSATDNDIVSIFRDTFEGSESVTAEVNTASADHVSAQLQVDNGLLQQLGVVPVGIASGLSADGRRLFTLQIARFGHDVALRTLTTDASGLNAISEWRTVDLDAHVVEFSWQSASQNHSDGYFAVAAGGTPVLIDGRTISDQLSYLQITVENNVPWLTLIEQ